ncbi:MAG TPA: metallophosphoesterase [Phycisphaerales bacterium]|nr:metallophosphoesterase [Phycisphaerales bacterium]
MFRFILFAILAADILWWWRADYLARRAGRVWLRVAVAVFMGVQLGMIGWIFASRLMGAAMPHPPTLIMTTVYLWHLLILPVLIVVMVPWHAVRRVVKAYRSHRTHRSDRTQTAEPEQAGALPPLTRRGFITAAVAAPPLATLALTGYSRARLQHFRVRPMTIEIASLPRELDGLTIAHVSDVHVGTFTDDRLLRKIVEATNQLAPDLILLPGDLINNRLADLPAALDAVTAMQPRHATLMCVGNHDLIENGQEFIRRTKERTPLLVNESAAIRINGRDVQVLGLPWRRSDDQISESVADIARKVQPGAFPILLAHHPHAFDEAARQGLPLTLSGHTHGGQLMANENIGFGPLMYRYWTGLYRKPEHDNAALVVSNGVGHWYPIRLSAPAEIIHITLRCV